MRTGMFTSLTGFAAILLYLAAFFSRLRGLAPVFPPRLLAAVALPLHAIALGGEMFGAAGVQLGLFNMLSLICWAIVLLVLVSSLSKPLQNLLPALLPVAAMSLVLSLATRSGATPRADLPPGLVAHLLIAVLAFSVISIATLQALFLRYANRQLKNRSDSRLLRALPPLQTMEALLFELLVTGLILLSLTLGSGFLFMTDIMAQRVVHHTVLALAAWIVFAVLLWGHWRLGWRGATASSLTLAGYGLLVLGYFGSKLVLEMILLRA